MNSNNESESGQGATNGEDNYTMEDNAMEEHELGVWDGDGPEEVVTDVTNPTTFQSFPKTELGAFMARQTLIHTQDLSSTDTPEAQTFLIKPWDLFLANPFITDKTANFLYIRGTLKITIKTMALPTAYGLYILSAVPNGDVSGFTAAVAANLPYEAALQTRYHAMYDIAQSADITMELPFFWPYDVATISTGAGTIGQSWDLILTCYHPVQHATETNGPARASMRIFACSEDCELIVPNFQAGKKNGSKPDAVEDGGLKPSGAVRGVSNFLSNLSAVPGIGAFAAPASAVGNAAANVMEAFGYTKEADPRNPMPVVQNSVSSVAVADGKDSSAISAMLQHNTISYDPQLATGESTDEASFASLFEHWTLVSDFNWSQSNAAGDTLATFPVSPFATHSFGVSRQFALTPAGFVGLPFEYWRGGMEYMLYIPVSKLHRGTLQVFWRQAGAQVPAGDITNVAMNSIIDIAPAMKMVFSIDYARDAPYCRSVIINASAIGSADLMNGTLYIRVVNPLSGPRENFSTTGFLFARAKEDMRFYVPRHTIVYQEGNDLSSTTMYNLGVQAGALGDDLKEDVHYYPLVPAGGEYPAADISMGEEIASVRVMLQKPSFVQTAVPVSINESALNAANGTIVVGNLPPVYEDGATIQVRALATGSRPGFIYAGYYRTIFAAVAGSMRVKCISQQNAYIGAGPLVVPNGTASAASYAITMKYNNPIAPFTYVGANRGAEFTIPWYTRRKFQPGNLIMDVNQYQERVNSIRIYGDKPVPIEQEGPTTAVFLAFGPDVRVSMFRFIPLVSIPTPSADPAAMWFLPTADV